MTEWFRGLDPVAQAGMAGLSTWGMTAPGPSGTASSRGWWSPCRRSSAPRRSSWWPLLPYALGFAAGAMLYVVIEELIPESQRGGYTDLATMSAPGGFIVVMILDVALA